MRLVRKAIWPKRWMRRGRGWLRLEIRKEPKDGWDERRDGWEEMSIGWDHTTDRRHDESDEWETERDRWGPSGRDGWRSRGTDSNGEGQMISVRDRWYPWGTLRWGCARDGWSQVDFFFYAIYSPKIRFLGDEVASAGLVFIVVMEAWAKSTR